MNNFTLNSGMFTQMVESPLDQFELRDFLSITFFSLKISLSNIGFYLIVGALIVLSLNLLATNYNRVISNR
jgi:F-type H+-transporting ATPase subunit a